MSFLSDELGFESFVGKDFFRGLSKDPKRIFLGVDPLSTKAWNGILGRKDAPLVDQLGGAYGGHTISAFGKNDGGVYARARDAGIDTGAGEKMQDAAHVIASIYGANGLYGATGGTTGSGVTGPWETGKGLLGSSSSAPANDLGIFSNNGVGGMSQVGGGNAGVLAQQGGIGGGAGYGAASPSSLGIQDYMKMAQGMGGQQQQGQQQPAPQAPPAEQSDAFRQLLARQARAQMLRRKLNRTPQENQELRDLTQGLLSNA